MPTYRRVTPAEQERRRRLADLRERTRVYKDDEGHTWNETAEHFGIQPRAAQYRVYRARKERAEEAAAKVQPSLPLDDPAQQELSLEETDSPA